MFNWWEELAINLVLGLVHGLVKNPSKQSTFRSILLHLADSIDIAYGLTPPTHD